MNEQFDISKIKLIVGLGNIGDKFQFTRHNAGFLFQDNLASKLQVKFKFEKIFLGEFSEFLFNANKIYLLKPHTMMNESGKSVRACAKFYKILPSEILIVHDDLDINLGKSLLQFGKGPKVHNGIISIENSIGTTKFWRSRIGVDSRSSDERQYMSGADYVLKKMAEGDFFTLQNSTAEAIQVIFNKTENVSQNISKTT